MNRKYDDYKAKRAEPAEIDVPARVVEVPISLTLYTERRRCKSCNSVHEYPLADVVVNYKSGRRARYSARIRQQIHHLSLERKVDSINTLTSFCPNCWRPGPALPRESSGFLLQEWQQAKAKPFKWELEKAAKQPAKRRPQMQGDDGIIAARDEDI